MSTCVGLELNLPADSRRYVHRPCVAAVLDDIVSDHLPVDCAIQVPSFGIGDVADGLCLTAEMFCDILTEAFHKEIAFAVIDGIVVPVVFPCPWSVVSEQVFQPPLALARYAEPVVPFHKLLPDVFNVADSAFHLGRAVGLYHQISCVGISVAKPEPVYSVLADVVEHGSLPLFQKLPFPNRREHL